MLTLESVTAWLRDNGQTAAVEALLSDADEPAAAAAAAAAAAPDCDRSSSDSESRALNGGIGEESAPSGQSDPAPSEAAPSEAPPDRPQVAPRAQVAPTFSPRLPPPLPLRLSSCGLRAASRRTRCRPVPPCRAGGRGVHTREGRTGYRDGLRRGRRHLLSGAPACHAPI